MSPSNRADLPCNGPAWCASESGSPSVKWYSGLWQPAVLSLARQNLSKQTNSCLTSSNLKRLFAEGFRLFSRALGPNIGAEPENLEFLDVSLARKGGTSGHTQSGHTLCLTQSPKVSLVCNNCRYHPRSRHWRLDRHIQRHRKCLDGAVSLHRSRSYRLRPNPRHRAKRTRRSTCFHRPRVSRLRRAEPRL